MLSVFRWMSWYQCLGSSSFLPMAYSVPDLCQRSAEVSLSDIRIRHIRIIAVKCLLMSNGKPHAYVLQGYSTSNAYICKLCARCCQPFPAFMHAAWRKVLNQPGYLVGLQSGDRESTHLAGNLVACPS